MAIELITGYAGQGHVSSADIGALNAGIVGSGRYITRALNQFSYTLNGVNEIIISSGVLFDQGRGICIPYGTTEAVSIENGSQGKSRIDTVVMTYSKDASTGVETAGISILQGTEVSYGQTPEPSDTTVGNIFAGASYDEVPLYYIRIDDLAIASVTRVLPVMDALSDIKETLINALMPVGYIYISVSSVSPATLFGGSWTQISGRFLLAADASHVAGSTGGAENHTLSTEEMPVHNHSLNNHVHTVPAHTHSASTASAGAHTHSIPRWQQATPTAGGSGRLAQGSNDSSYVTSKAGAHTHGVTVASKPAFATTGASGNTGNTGSGTAFSLMPPYLAVYMWKRTA